MPRLRFSAKVVNKIGWAYFYIICVTLSGNWHKINAIDVTPITMLPMLAKD